MVAVRAYVPAGTLMKMNFPSRPLVAVRSPVTSAGPVSFRAAPGITAPVVSMTVPVIVPSETD